MPQPVNPAAKLAPFSGRWSPGTVSRVNGHEVMVAKPEGEFPWHLDADDPFLVLDGRIRTEQGDVSLGPGDLQVVPERGRHRAAAEAEAHALINETTATQNTGDPATAADRTEIRC